MQGEPKSAKILKFLKICFRNLNIEAIRLIEVTLESSNHIHLNKIHFLFEIFHAGEAKVSSLVYDEKISLLGMCLEFHFILFQDNFVKISSDSELSHPNNDSVSQIYGIKNS